MLKRLTTLFITALFVASGFAFTMPHSAYADSEAIFNVWESNGTNYAFSVTYTDGYVQTVSPDHAAYGNFAYFTLFSWECAFVSYNGNPSVLRGPGKHYFADGAWIHVDPHKC